MGDTSLKELKVKGIDKRHYICILIITALIIMSAFCFRGSFWRLVEVLFGLKLAKDKNGIKVYRNYGTKFIEEKIDKKTIYELNLEDMVDMSTKQFDFSKLETDDEKIAEEMDLLFRTQNAKQLELEIETEDNTSKLIKKIEELKKVKQEGKGRERR